MEAAGRAPAIQSPPWESGEEPPIESHLGRPGKAVIPTVSRSKTSQGLYLCHFLCLENSQATHSTNSYSSFRTQCKSHFFREALLDSSVFLRLQWYKLSWHSVLLVCIRASHVHSCSVTSVMSLCDPVEYSLPDSSVHGILQARILEWVSMPSSRGSS